MAISSDPDYVALLKEFYSPDVERDIRSTFLSLIQHSSGDFSGGTMVVDFAAMERDRQRVNWLRAFGKFPIPLQMGVQHPPLPLTNWPCNAYDCGKSLVFPVKKER